MDYPDKNCRLSMSSIVKNEAATLAQCLVSVRDLVDEIVVVDTGSIDHSKDIALRHGARVFDLLWPDSFAAARNESIRHATGQWLLWLDADEYFDESNRDKLRRLVAELNDDNTAYVMQQRSAASNGSATLVGQVRLFRNHPDIRWDYRVHEQILPSLRKAGHAVRFTDIVIEHTGYLDPALRQGVGERFSAGKTSGFGVYSDRRRRWRDEGSGLGLTRRIEFAVSSGVL